MEQTNPLDQSHEANQIKQLGSKLTMTTKDNIFLTLQLAECEKGLASMTTRLETQKQNTAYYKEMAKDWADKWFQSQDDLTKKAVALKAALDDYKGYYETMQTQPSCNNCGIRTSCPYAPAPGTIVRINCPLWSNSNSGGLER